MGRSVKQFFSSTIFVFMAGVLIFPFGFPIPVEAAFLTGGNLPNQFANNGSSIYYTSGNLGVGTTAPGAKLHVLSNGDVAHEIFDTTATTNKRVRINFAQNGVQNMEIATDYGMNNTADLYIYNRATTQVAAYFNPNGNVWFNPTGNVGIGTTDPGSYKLSVAGNVYSSGNFGATGSFWGTSISDSNGSEVKTVSVDPQAAKVIIFKSPKPGRYEFEYRILGNDEIIGRGEMISSVKPEITAAEKLKDEPKIPGASMIIKNGVIQPVSFSVAANSPVRIVFNSGDNQIHKLVFDQDEVLKIGEVFVNPKLNSFINSEGLSAGEYEFRCTVPGHETERGKMIVK